MTDRREHLRLVPISEEQSRLDLLQLRKSGPEVDQHIDGPGSPRPVKRYDRGELAVGAILVAVVVLMIAFALVVGRS